MNETRAWMTRIRAALVADRATLLPLLREGARRHPVRFGALFGVAVLDNFRGAAERSRISEFADHLVSVWSDQGFSVRDSESVIRGVLGELELCDDIAVGGGVYVDVGLAVTHELLNNKYQTIEDIDSFLGRVEGFAAETVRVNPELLVAQDSALSADFFESSSSSGLEESEPESLRGPRTIVAQWQRATVLGQRELRERLRKNLNGGEDDEAGFLQASFELAVRRYFTQSIDTRDITSFAHDILASFGVRDLNVVEVEAMIRRALGESSASIGGISVRSAFNIRHLVLHHICEILSMSPGELDHLLVEAEDLAEERGFHPAVAQ